MESSVPHASSCTGALIWRGVYPWDKFSNHTAAKDLITVQQALLRAASDRAGCLAGFLGPIDPVRASAASDPQGQASGDTP